MSSSQELPEYEAMNSPAMILEVGINCSLHWWPSSRDTGKSMCSDLRTNIFTINQAVGNTFVNEKHCYFTEPTPLFIYWLHTPACVMPPFFPHQIIHSMQFTKEQFTTLNRYFKINFGQVYLFCVKALLITFPSRPSSTHDFVTSAILFGAAFQRCIVSQITDPKERKSERRDEIRDTDTRISRSVTGRWVFIVHRSTVTDTSRSLVGIFLQTRMYLVHQLPITQPNIYDLCSTRSVLFRWGSHSPPGILVNSVKSQCTFQNISTTHDSLRCYTNLSWYFTYLLETARKQNHNNH